MFNTTGVSISIEKNKIEVLKSFPISAMDIFVPKVALQLYLSIPVIIVLNSVMAVMLKFDFRTILLGYLMPITFSAFSSVLGYGINILLPNFDWENITFEDLIRNDYMNYFDKLKLLQYLQQHDVIRFI